VGLGVEVEVSFAGVDELAHVGNGVAVLNEVRVRADLSRPPGGTGVAAVLFVVALAAEKEPAEVAPEPAAPPPLPMSLSVVAGQRA